MKPSEPAVDEMEDEAGGISGLYWVAAFIVDLMCGGPEDGGWYYWTGTLVVDPDVYETLGYGPAGFPDIGGAKLHASRMRETLPALNQGRPNITSVLSIGIYEVRMMRALTLPTYFPDTPPRYE